MSYRKDLKSKAKDGRYFPQRFGDIVKLVKEYGLAQFDGERIAVQLKNIDCKFGDGYLLIDIVPEEDVAVYSLPNELDKDTAKNALSVAFEAITKHLKQIKNTNSKKYSYCCGYLSDDLRVMITRRDISKKVGKYRSGMKFSYAFKAKQVKDDEVLLETINLAS